MKSMLADIQSSLFEMQSHSASLNSMSSDSQSDFRGLVQQHIDLITEDSSQVIEYKGNTYDLSQLKSIVMPQPSAQDLVPALPDGGEVQVPNSSVTLLPVTEVQIKQTVAPGNYSMPLDATGITKPGEALPVTGKSLPPANAGKQVPVIEAAILTSSTAKQHSPLAADSIQLAAVNTVKIDNNPVEANLRHLQPVMDTQVQGKAGSQPLLAENLKGVPDVKAVTPIRNTVNHDSANLDTTRLPGKDKLESAIRDSLQPVNQQSLVSKPIQETLAVPVSRNPASNGSIPVAKQNEHLAVPQKPSQTGESPALIKVKPAVIAAQEATVVAEKRGPIQPTTIPASLDRLVKSVRSSSAAIQTNTDSLVTTSDPVKPDPMIVPPKTPQVVSLKASNSSAVEVNFDGLKASQEKSQVNLNPVARTEVSVSETASPENTRTGQLLPNQTQQPATVQTQPGVTTPVVAVPTANPAFTQSLPPSMNPQPHADALMLSKNADAGEWGKGLGDRVSWMINQKLDSATIRIDPPSLGKLDVMVKVSDDITTITIQTQHAQTRDLVDASAHRLRDFMQESGFQNVNVDVSHRQDQQQARSQQGNLNDNKSAENGLENNDSAEEDSEQQFYRGDGLVDTFV